MGELALAISRLYVIVSISAVAYKVTQEIAHYIMKTSASKTLQKYMPSDLDSPDVKFLLEKISRKILKDDFISKQEIYEFTRLAVLCYVVIEDGMNGYFQTEYDKRHEKYKLLTNLTKIALEDKKFANLIYEDILNISGSLISKLPFAEKICKKDIERYSNRLEQTLPKINQEIISKNYAMISEDLKQDLKISA